MCLGIYWASRDSVMVQKEQEKGWDFGLDPLLLPSSSESLTAPHPSKGASLGEAPGFSDEDP